MNEMVSLPLQKRTWRAEGTNAPVRVTKTWSQWRCARGYKIHRAKHAAIYRPTWGEKRPYLAFAFLCGQHALNPIPFREECAEGTSPCGKCEGLFQAARREQ